MKLTTTGPASPVQSKDSASATGGRSTGRVTKRDWLDAGLHFLVAGGVDAVRINDLARHLEISKSGFYWHFTDRSGLLEAIKRYWIDEFSTQFIEHTRTQKGSLRERLVSLVHNIRKKESGKLDLAFASWAQSDASVRGLVDQVRDMRIAFAKEMLAETDAIDPELTTRANLFVIYFMWADNVLERGKDALVGEDLDRVLDIITGAPPPGDPSQT